MVVLRYQGKTARKIEETVNSKRLMGNGIDHRCLSLRSQEYRVKAEKDDYRKERP